MSQSKYVLQRILIARTDRIGDLILTLPLAVALKKLFPSSHLTFLVRNYTAEIARNCAAVDEVLIVPETNGVIQTVPLMNLLKQGGFDSAFLVYPDKKVSWASFRAGIPIRIGTAFRWYSFLFNHKVRDHRKEVRFHELEYNLRMLHAVNLRQAITPQLVDYQFSVPEATVQQVPLPFSFEGVTRPIVVVHPGSGGSAIDLPAEKFRQLTELLSNTNKYTVLVTGNANESDLCASVCAGTNAINLSGKLNLLQLMVIIQKSNIFVSNSTGPLHIAAALGKHVIGFFPKIKTCSPERWAPYAKQRAVFVPEIGCSDCTREQCGRLQCMNSIDINKVLQQIENFSISVD